MAHDVFISHSSEDKAIADAICAALETKKVRCWVAPRDILPGQDWAGAIVDAIAASRVMVLIFSSKAHESEHVKKELTLAVNAKVIIVPFKLDDIPLKGMMQYYLSDTHWLDAMNPPTEQQIAKLVETVQRLIAADTAAEVPVEGEGLSSQESALEAVPPTVPMLGQPLWRRLLSNHLFIASLLVVFLAIVGLWVWQQNRPAAITDLPGQQGVADVGTPVPTPTETAEPTPEFYTLEPVGEYPTSRTLEGVFVTGKTAYLANSGDGLVLLDLGDPANPALLGQFEMENAKEVVVGDGTAYVIQDGVMKDNRIPRDKLVLLDVQTSSQPKQIGEHEVEGDAFELYNITLADEYVVLSTHSYVELVDVGDPASPQLLWSWESPGNSGNPCDAFILGDSLYITGGWTGIHIFDLSNPHAPEALASFDTVDWAIDILVVDEIAYVTLGDAGLMTLDVSDRTRPALMSRIQLDAFASQLALGDDYAYVSYFNYDENRVTNSGIKIVDISNPSEMQIAGEFGSMDSVNDVTVFEDKVFAALQGRGLAIMQTVLESP
jgi:hypothetical protein